jgi:sugar phosphate isomerase/epimerase
MSRFRLGVSLHTVNPTLTTELVAALAEARVSTVELYPPLLDTDPTGTQTTALRQLLARGPVRAATVHARFGGEYDISVDDAAKRRAAVGATLDALRLATEFGAPMVVVHASAEPISATDRQRRLGHSQAALAEIVAAAQARRLRIAVELLPRTCLGNTLEELGTLLAGLPADAAGVCLDVNHVMNRQAELPAYIRRLGPRLFTLHLSDYDGVDEKHWLPGRGVIDWHAVTHALGDIGYTGPFNYEAKPDGDTPRDRFASYEANFAWLVGQ